LEVSLEFWPGRLYFSAQYLCLITLHSFIIAPGELTHKEIQDGCVQAMAAFGVYFSEEYQSMSFVYFAVLD